HVSAEFPARGKDTLFVSLPAWSPGSYEIQNYARYVRRFGAKNARGQPLFWDRLDKDTWRVVTSRSDIVTAEFDYLADTIDLSLARIAGDFGQFLGTNVFLYEKRQLEAPADDHYTVFFNVSREPINFGGGLEHSASQFDIMPQGAFADALGNFGDFMVPLMSHEYFHLFNVKRIRPAEMWPYDYHAEQYTPLLW